MQKVPSRGFFLNGHNDVKIKKNGSRRLSVNRFSFTMKDIIQKGSKAANATSCRTAFVTRIMRAREDVQKR